MKHLWCWYVSEVCLWEEMMVEETKTSWEICIHQMRRNRDGERRYKDQDKRKSEQDSYRDTETIYFVCALGWLVCSTWSPVQTVHKYRKEALLLTNIKEYVHNDLTYFRANNVLLKIMTEQIKPQTSHFILKGKNCFWTRDQYICIRGDKKWTNRLMCRPLKWFAIYHF